MSLLICHEVISGCCSGLGANTEEGEGPECEEELYSQVRVLQMQPGEQRVGPASPLGAIFTFFLF